MSELLNEKISQYGLFTERITEVIQEKGRKALVKLVDEDDGLERYAVLLKTHCWSLNYTNADLSRAKEWFDTTNKGYEED